MNKHTLVTFSLLWAATAVHAADPVWLKDFKQADLNDSGGLSAVELKKTKSTRLKPLLTNFQAIDSDQDGQVTRSEYETYLDKQKARLTSKQFNQGDLNDSGGLSLVELGKLSDQAFAPLKQNFDAIDSDKDGQITFAEYETFMVTLAPSATATIAAPITPPQDLCQPDCGVVVAVDRYKIEGEGSVLGAIAGGVAGGVLGNQVGGGTGKTIATVGGAAGGAYVGHKLEQKLKTKKMVKVTVKLDHGEQKDFDFETDQSPVAKGDRVRIEEGKPVKYTGQ